VRLDSEWLSFATNMATFTLLLYIVKSVKEVAIHWLYLNTQKVSDLLGPTELRYHGGRLKPVSPIILDTLHASSVEGRTIHPLEDSTGWNGLVEKFRGVVRARETMSSGS